MKSPKPTTRKGWAEYYAKQFNKTHSKDAAILAMWYEFLHLAFDSPDSPPHLTLVP